MLLKLCRQEALVAQIRVKRLGQKDSLSPYFAVIKFLNHFCHLFQCPPYAQGLPHLNVHQNHLGLTAVQVDAFW